MKLKQFLNDIDSRMAQGKRLVTAIDGLAASGKSTLAAYLHERYSCNVIPMDHFFLRPEQRVPQRLSMPGGNIDYERFLEEVIKPLKSGRAFSYRPYDCKSQQLSSPVMISPTQFTVVEGVYCLRPEFTSVYDIRVFMDLDKDMQHVRLSERGPALYERFVSEWLPMEDKYFKHFRIREACDYVLWGDDLPRGDDINTSKF